MAIIVGVAVDTDILEAAGVPIGAPRRPQRWPAPGELRTALARLSSAALPEELDDALLAWLSGFQHHWPDEFRVALGDLGPTLIERLEQRPRDWNRYLKLRRIAIENLASRGSAGR